MMHRKHEARLSRAGRAVNSRRWSALWLASSLSLWAGMASAEVYTLTVKVTVVEQTCDVSGSGGPNSPISVEFGDMVIRSIDGLLYEQPIPYSLDCADAGSNPGLRLMFNGTGAAFNANLLKTTTTNLGLQLKANGTALNMNTPLDFMYDTKPSLSAVPVKSGTDGVAGGEFTASATLSVEYQ